MYNEYSEIRMRKALHEKPAQTALDYERMMEMENKERRVQLKTLGNQTVVLGEILRA